MVHKSISFFKQKKRNYLLKNLICKKKTNFALFAVLLHRRKTSQRCCKSEISQFGIFDSKFSIDQMMTKYFGMHPFKMYIKCKPINFYFKFWCLHSSIGYLHSFSPNLRKNSDFNKTF